MTLAVALISLPISAAIVFGTMYVARSGVVEWAVRMAKRARKPKYAKGGVLHGKVDYEPEEGEWVIPLKQMRRILGLMEIKKRHEESEV